VPTELSTIEAAAEDIIDVLPHERWRVVARDTRDIGAAWSTYQRRAEADGAGADVMANLTRALSELRYAASTATVPAAAQSANDVSAATVELLGLYDSGVPVDIGRLDVVGRQIVFDVERGDLVAAGDQVQRWASIWRGGLRADVVAHHGRSVAARTDASLNAMERAVAAGQGQALVTQARVGLELVDAMERLY
jgi:hypothetical protein